MADILNPAGVVNEMLALAKDRSATATAKMEAYFDKAMGYAPSGGVKMTAAAVGYDPAVVEPKVHIPELAEGASVEMFESWWQKVNESLLDKAEWFFTRFFPNECPYLSRAQLWICKTLTQGGTGMSAQVEDMIWQRDRARVLKEAARAEGEVVSSFAARGFPLPPGAMTARLAEIQSESYDKIAQASRDVAIKQAEIEIDNVKFAVDKAINLYNNCINAVVDFVKALISSAGVSAQLIPSVTDSQSRLISAASEYYKARISVQDLILRSRTTDAGFRQEASKSNQASEMQAIEMRLRAAVEAAKALATEAAAALNALHANASISGTAGNSVSYSYQNDTTGPVSPITMV